MTDDYVFSFWMYGKNAFTGISLNSLQFFKDNQLTDYYY